MKRIIRDSSILPLILYASKYYRSILQLSASFYQCPNIPHIFLGDEMNSSQLELCQERGRVELLWQFQIFYLGILVQLFAINICHFRSLQWRGPQWKSLFWAYEKPHQAKNQFSVKPPSWFSLNMFYWEMGSYFWTLFKSKKNTLMTP